MKILVSIFIASLFLIKSADALQIKVDCKINKSSTTYVKRHISKTAVSYEWFLLTEQPFHLGGSTSLASTAYVNQDRSRIPLSVFSDHFKLFHFTYAYGDIQISKFWRIDRFTGYAEVKAYKFTKEDFNDTLNLLIEKYPEKWGTQGFEWINILHNEFVKPNFKRLYSDLGYNCEKVVEKKF